MREDINFPKVEGVGVAISLEKNEINQDEWNVYLVNFSDQEIYGVLVSSRGYGEIDGEKRISSTLRHFLDKIPPKSFMKIEPIHSDVFVLSNEYWVSFYKEAKLFDKKYIFVAGSITEENLIQVPILEKKAVIIK